MTRRLKLSCLLFAMLAVFSVLGLVRGAVAAESRVALVIGNAGYQHAKSLLNPGNDASAVAERLRGLGFSVVELRSDLDYARMRQALLTFRRAAEGADIAALFYAGHGIEVDGRNYLVPVDARLASAVDAEFEAVPLDLALTAVSGARKLRLVILDACRDNPFQARMASDTRSVGRSVGRGLARVEPTANTLVVYAAKAGSVAADGDGRHSPFTSALLEHLGEQGVEIDFTFRKVRDAVLASTSNRQEPFIYGSLSAEKFYLLPPVPAPSTPSTAAATPPPPMGSGFDPRALELAFWESIKDSERASDFEAYLAQYPTGVFAALAASRVVALKERQVASLPPAATVAPPAPALSVVDLDDSYVTVKTANLRAEPSTDAAKAGTLPPDTLVQATGKLADGSWVRVAHAGGAAWVWGPLVEPVDAGEHAAWSRASGGDASAVEGFLKAHPRGRYAVAAEARLAALRAPTPQAPPATPVVGTFPQTASRRPGEVFRDCGECPEMVVIPAGEFMMGSPDSEPGRDADEGPLRRVRIGYPLAVGKFEVTFAEWDACVSAGGCNHRPNDKGWGRGSRPVVVVNWGDAQAYVKWLSRTTGQRYRLLSESEWEYAARAGTTTPLHTGSRITTAQANFSGNQTVPVGRFGANLFGLHDMHGNVWEWVEDCWNRSYAGAPSDGSAWRSGECSRRVLRGGSWVLGPTSLR